MKQSPDTTSSSTSAPETNQADTKPEMSAEQELVYRLKTAIDSRGRYSFRLSDLSAGYAAGKGISVVAARQEIENEFSRQTGHSPQEYLDKHYQELKNSHSNGHSR